MLILSNFRWILLYFIFEQFHVHYVITIQPSSNTSNVQLLGLFQDADNASITTEISIHSRAMFKAALILSQQYNITINGQFIQWQIGQTGGNIIDALKDTCQAASLTNIVGIIGPELSRQAQLIASFGATTDIPVISYGATDPNLSDRNAYPTFYRTILSDRSAALAIVELFKRYNWTSCVIIYQNDNFGTGGSKVISEVFENNSLIIRETVIFDITTMSVRGDLKTSLTNSATRIVILWADSMYTHSVLQLALDLDVLGPKFTWILSSTVSLNSFSETVYNKLIGILTVEPAIASTVNRLSNITLLNAAYDIWQQFEPETFPKSREVNYYALYAFDATWTLIQALQRVCSINLNSSSSCLSFIEMPSCFDRQFLNSSLLLNAISSTEFLGVSGPIRFISNMTDRMNASYYYAQNIQPSSNGLDFVPVLDYTESNGWKMHIGATVIVWPGGLILPSTGEAVLEDVTLRIGIIESRPFVILKNVTDASGQNRTNYTGYIPDLINRLQSRMKFIPDLQLVPSNETYDELTQAVANGRYDMLMGDITITSARREKAAFSQAIFDNSLCIIMRQNPDISIDLLSFLKPFSRDLWLLILAACIYAGILICLIERQDNEALQNRSIFSQIVMSIWYSFGNIVGYGVEFSVRTAAGRLMTVGLYILGLILVASYTANLTSDLTVLKTKDFISGINDIKSGKIPFNRIGILIGTASDEYYVREVSNTYYPLYSGEEVYDSLLQNIIDASFLDIGVAQYMTNNIYCNLTIVGEDFDKGAFGIVTPKEWLYANDLDVHILQLKESGELENIKQKWFEGKICSESSETSSAMQISSLAGLFLTFAVISILSLLLFGWKKRNHIKDNAMSLTCQKKSFKKRRGSTRKNSTKTFDSSKKPSLIASELIFF